MGGLRLTHDDEFLTRPVAAADGELVINSSSDTMRCKKFSIAADTADRIISCDTPQGFESDTAKKEKKNALIEFSLFFLFLFLHRHVLKLCIKIH